MGAINDLPDKVKIVYHALLSEFDKMMNDVNEKERSYKASYLKKRVRFYINIFLMKNLFII